MIAMKKRPLTTLASVLLAFTFAESAVSLTASGPIVISAVRQER
jgi:hypothetical protein